MSLVNVPKLQELYFHPWKLPLETLTLVDDEFYTFIEHLVGPTLSRLLRAQEINSVPILLLTSDVFDHLFLKFNDVETDFLRQELLLRIDNSNPIVKGASRTKIKCLLDILKAASDRKAKQSQRSTSTTRMYSPRMSTSSTTTTTTIAPAAAAAMSSTLSLDDQKTHLLRCIDDWATHSEEHFDLKQLQLKEGDDFKLNLTVGVSGPEATIECRCKSKIVLGKLDGKLIPSNYYRHLKSSNCQFVNHLLREQREQLNTNNSNLNPTIVPSSSQSTQFSITNSQLTAPVVSPRKRSLDSSSRHKSRKRRKQ